MSALAAAVPQAMERGGATVAATSGLVAFATKNATLITVTCGVIGVLIAIAGLAWQIYRDIKRDQKKRELDLELHAARMAQLEGKEQ
jgi:uncharacterized membrane protein YebE (DUF533 family)